MALRLRTPLPSITGITKWVNGEVQNQEIENKPLLVHFWSISCEMCKESFEQINQMRNDLANLQLVGIHMPRMETDTDIDKVIETINKYNLKHPQGIDNEHTVVDAFENEYVPAFYLFDSNHLLRHRSAGEKALSMLQKPLERVLSEES